MNLKTCFNSILFLGIWIPISIESLSQGNSTGTVFRGSNNDGPNLLLPWPAISNLLTSMGNGRTVVMFINETIGVPSELLGDLYQSWTRLVLTECKTDPSIERLEPFLRELQEVCRGYCIFMVQCNMAVTQRLVNNSLNFNLFRPWTLWMFTDPQAIILLDDTPLKWTGVAIGIPSCNEDGDLSNFDNADLQSLGSEYKQDDVLQENCSNYSVVKVYVRNNTDNRLLATFSPNANHSSENGSKIEQNVRSAQEYFEATFGKLLNMQNSTIKVAAYELSPILIIKNNTGKTGRTYEGVSIKIVEQFANAMNFRYELVPVLDIGSKTKNGTRVKWDGIMGDIRDRKMDLAIGAISVTEDRLEAVDFTQDFLEDTSSIIYNAPQQRSRILIFIKVFPWQVWLMLLLAILVLGPAFTFFEKMKYIESENLTATRVTVWESWWTLITSTVQKGEVGPVGVPGRALATFWLLFLLVLVGTYSGMLLATMSFPGYVTTYESLRQFEDTNTPFPITLKPSSTYSNIEGAETPAASIIQKRWRKSPHVVFPYSPEEVPSYLETGKYAFLSERLIVQPIIFDQLQKCNCCPYYIAKKDFLTQYYSFVVPKNSPLSASMNIILRRLFQAGITQQWLKRSMPKTGRCQDLSAKKSDVLNAMNLLDIQGAFYTLGIGLIASLLALAVEICYSKRMLKIAN